MAKTLDELVSESEIKDLQIRYCRAVDRIDFDLLRACFHPDAETDYGFISGGVDQFIEQGKASLRGFLHTTHFTGNQLVEVSGDVAWAEHYTVATHRIAASENLPARDLVTSVRYTDRLERRSGEWRIAKRLLTLDWVRTDPVQDFGPEPDVPRGRRDRSDRSYELAARSG
jgi:hypothetical protein